MSTIINDTHAALAGLRDEISALVPERTLEQRVAEWVISRLGAGNLEPKERAMRVLEEALELAQSEGIDVCQSVAMAEHVYGREVGEPVKEMAGLLVCALGWCAARGYRMNHLAEVEIARIEAKPIEQIQASLQRKRDAGLVLHAEAKA